jgi:hypothetical protein
MRLISSTYQIVCVCGHAVELDSQGGQCRGCGRLIECDWSYASEPQSLTPGLLLLSQSPLFDLAPIRLVATPLGESVALEAQGPDGRQ